jgi:hypothetical protein
MKSSSPTTPRTTKLDRRIEEVKANRLGYDPRILCGCQRRVWRFTALGACVSKDLSLRLVVPLACAFALSIGLHFLWPAAGFFINLSTVPIGIIVTVFYVDWILARHEQMRWQVMDKRIAARMKTLLNAMVSSIRVSLNFGPKIIDPFVQDPLNPDDLHAAVMSAAGRVVQPALYQRIAAFTPADWQRLQRQILPVHNAILQFLNAFHARLSPEQNAKLLDMEEALTQSLIAYQTFPDVAGVPLDQVPHGKTPPEILQKHISTSAADGLSKALTISYALSNSLKPSV